jgi:hypothetical protein
MGPTLDAPLCDAAGELLGTPSEKISRGSTRRWRSSVDLRKDLDKHELSLVGYVRRPWVSRGCLTLDPPSGSAVLGLSPWHLKTQGATLE